MEFFVKHLNKTLMLMKLEQHANFYNHIFMMLPKQQEAKHR